MNRPIIQANAKEGIEEFIRNMNKPPEPFTEDEYWIQRQQEGNLTLDELYVIEKHKIEALNLPCGEYEKAINELCDRIGY